MNYLFFSTLSQMGFWITWLLIPILVETVPAISSFVKIFFIRLVSQNLKKIQVSGLLFQLLFQYITLKIRCMNAFNQFTNRPIL